VQCLGLPGSMFLPKCLSSVPWYFRDQIIRFIVKQPFESRQTLGLLASISKFLTFWGSLRHAVRDRISF
jgi:hypothetical protein